MKKKYWIIPLVFALAAGIGFGGAYLWNRDADSAPGGTKEAELTTSSTKEPKTTTSPTKEPKTTTSPTKESEPPSKVPDPDDESRLLTENRKNLCNGGRVVYDGKEIFFGKENGILAKNKDSMLVENQDDLTALNLNGDSIVALNKDGAIISYDQNGLTVKLVEGTGMGRNLITDGDTYYYIAESGETFDIVKGIFGEHSIGNFVSGIYSAYAITLYDGWIYYSSATESDGKGLYKIKTDGSDKQKIDNVLYTKLIITSDACIYGLYESEINGIAKIPQSGNASHTSQGLNADYIMTDIMEINDNIYYIEHYPEGNHADKIVKIDSDSLSGGNVIAAEQDGETFSSLSVADGKLYCVCEKDGEASLRLVDVN